MAFESAALISLSGRGKLEVGGVDRIDFLQAMLSNDVAKLEEFRGCYATFLTATGKMVTDLYCYRFPDRVWLDLSSGRTGATLRTLEKFIIMEEVEIIDRSEDFDHFSIQGPEATEILREVTRAKLPEDHLAFNEVDWEGVSLVVIRKGEIHPQGFEIIVPKKAASQLRSQLLSDRLSIRPVSIRPGTLDIMRLEAGIPRFGIDMDTDHYPMEARLSSAISLSKGCYIGQEVVAKATYIGGVPRLLVRLQVEGDEIPNPGARILDEQGRRAGIVTSAAYSFRLRTPIALGYVRRKLSEPDQHLQIETSEGNSLPAKVVEEFSAGTD